MIMLKDYYLGTVFGQSATLQSQIQTTLNILLV